MSFSTYHELFSLVQDAWNGHYDVDSFRLSLRSFFPSLIDPRERSPRPEDSEALRRDRRVTVDSVFVDLSDKSCDGDKTTRTLDFVLTLSSNLQLNEYDSVRLLCSASSELNRRGIATSQFAVQLPDLAFQLYYQRRFHLLVSLLDLILLYKSSPSYVGSGGDPSQGSSVHSDSMLRIVNEFISELLRQGLTTNLLHLLDDLCTRKSHESTRKQTQMEIIYCIRILFALYRKEEITNHGFTELLAFFQRRAAPLNPSIPLQIDQPFADFLSYTLLFLVWGALEVKFAAVEFGNTSGLYLGQSEIQSELKQFLKIGNAEAPENPGDAADRWSSVPLQAGFYLGWALFLKRIKPLFPELAIQDSTTESLTLLALSPDVSLFATLETQFYSSAFFQSEVKLKEFICDITAEFVCSIVNHGRKELEMLRKEEKKHEILLQRHAQQQRIPALGHYQESQQASEAAILPAAPQNFSSLLAIIARVCRFSSVISGLMWSTPAFSEFLFHDLVDSASGPHSPGLGSAAKFSAGPAPSSSSLFLSGSLFSSYINVLSALCNSPNGAETVYYQLKKASKLNWDVIFSSFQQVINGFLQSTAPAASARGPQSSRAVVQPRSLSDRESAMLKSMLRLVSSVLSSRTIQSLVYRTPEYRALDRLFGLLGCRFFSPSLKASVLECISAFGRGSPDITEQIWTKLEKSHILPVAAPGAPMPVEGLYFDLEEIEKPQRMYPLTIAFTQLILTLLHSSRPQRLAYTPFISFIADKIFLGLNERFYEKVEEKWKLIEICMAIFNKCIKEYEENPWNPSGQTAPTDANLSYVQEEKSHAPMHAGGLFSAFQQPEQAVVAPVSSVQARHAGYEFQKLLLQGKEFFSKLLLAIEGASALISESAESPVMEAEESAESTANAIPHAEGAFLFASELLSLVLADEENFLSQIRMSEPKAKCLPLSSLLFSQQREILTIARSVAYEQLHQNSTDPQRLRLKDEYQHFQSTKSGSTQQAGLQRQASLNMTLNHSAADLNASAFDGDLNALQENPEELEEHFIFTDSTEIAFFALSILESLVRSDDLKLVHLIEAAHATPDIVKAFAFQLKNSPPVSSLALTAESAAPEDPSESKYFTVNDSMVQLQAAQPPPEDAEGQDEDRVNRTRLLLLEVLLVSLSHRNPQNFAHLVLGFDVNRDIRLTDLHGSARRDLLDSLIELVRKPRFPQSFPAVATSVYQVFYQLLSSQFTNRPLISFLQRFDQFFFELLDSISSSSASVSRSAAVNLLLQKTWILRTIALELYGQSRSTDGVNEFMESALFKFGILVNEEERRALLIAPDNAIEQGTMKILELLDSLHLALPQPQRETIPDSIHNVSLTPAKVFDPVLRSFQWDIKALFFILVNDCGMDAASAAKTSRLALKLNELSRLLSASSLAFNAWKQCLELLLHTAFSPSDFSNRYEVVLMEILLNLLNKLVSEDPLWLALSEPLSAAALTVLAKLREQVTTLGMDRPLTKSELVFELILQAALQHRHHATRANLYAMIAHYAQFSDSGDANRQSVNIDELSPTMDKNFALLNQYGARLIDLLTQDAADGSPLLKNAAFAVLQILVAFEMKFRSIQSSTGMGIRTNKWAPMLRQKSVLSVFVHQLQQKDEAIRLIILNARPDSSYDPILTFESLMAFLIEFAHSEEGARLLWECDAVKVLSSFQTMKIRILETEGILAAAATPSFLPSPLERYHAVLIPTLQLFIALIASHPSHTQLHRQILTFVTSHASNLFVPILRDSFQSVKLSGLQLLQLTTALFYQLYQSPIYRLSPAVMPSESFRPAQMQTPATPLSAEPKSASRLFGLGSRVAGLLKYVGFSGPAEPIAAETPSHRPVFQPVSDEREKERIAIEKYEKLLVLLLEKYARPHLIHKLRPLLSSALNNFQDSNFSALGSDSANAPDFPSRAERESSDIETADDLIEEILRNLLAIFSSKSLENSQSGGLVFGPQLQTAGDYFVSIPHAALMEDFDDSSAGGEEGRQFHGNLYVLIYLLEREIHFANSMFQRLSQLNSALGNVHSAQIADLCHLTGVEFGGQENFPLPIKRTVLYRALKQQIETAEMARDRIHFLMEHLMMLLFQHLNVFLDASDSEKHRLRGGAPSQAGQYRKQVEKVLMPVLDRLAESIRIAVHGSAALPASIDAPGALVRYGEPRAPHRGGLELAGPSKEERERRFVFIDSLSLKLKRLLQG